MLKLERPEDQMAWCLMLVSVARSMYLLLGISATGSYELKLFNLGFFKACPGLQRAVLLNRDVTYAVDLSRYSPDLYFSHSSVSYFQYLFF